VNDVLVLKSVPRETYTNKQVDMAGIISLLITIFGYYMYFNVRVQYI